MTTKISTRKVSADTRNMKDALSKDRQAKSKSGLIPAMESLRNTALKETVEGGLVVRTPNPNAKKTRVSMGHGATLKVKTAPFDTRQVQPGMSPAMRQLAAAALQETKMDLLPKKGQKPGKVTLREPVNEAFKKAFPTSVTAEQYAEAQRVTAPKPPAKPFVGMRLEMSEEQKAEEDAKCRAEAVAEIEQVVAAILMGTEGCAMMFSLNGFHFTYNEKMLYHFRRDTENHPILMKREVEYYGNATYATSRRELEEFKENLLKWSGRELPQHMVNVKALHYDTLANMFFDGDVELTKLLQGFVDHIKIRANLLTLQGLFASPWLCALAKQDSHVRELAIVELFGLKEIALEALEQVIKDPSLRYGLFDFDGYMNQKDQYIMLRKTLLNV